MALPAREERGNQLLAPCCALIVIAALAAAMQNSGTFSITSQASDRAGKSVRVGAGDH